MTTDESTETISPQLIADAVVGMHDAIDQIKEDSILLVDLLEHLIEDNDDPELEDELIALIEFAHTPYRRIMESEEASLRPLGADDEVRDAE